MTLPFLTTIRAEMANRTDADRATQMAAYMKTDQPFYGIPAKECLAIFRAARKQHPIATADDYETIIFDLWNGVHREEMYQALRVAEMTRRFYNLDSWHSYERLVHTATWWDTLDWIAGSIVSGLYKKHPDFVEPHLIAWRTADKMWVRRAALLAHLKQKVKTNNVLLGETILLLAHEKEFFIRKAIGWVLRDYSYANPAWVEQFVHEHDAVLSNLSKHEAMKVIERKRIAKDR